MGKLYDVGAYIRLSKESAAYAGDESQSIGNQREMLSKFIAMMPGWVEKRFYIDDGYSGGTFQRPAFLEMMEDVRGGFINLVLVKDLSRFGRNYLEAGNFLENELPARGCRFVSLSEGIDTETGENDILPFLNAMNDYYLKNLSDRIKTVLTAKAKDGQKISGTAPYGYYRNPEDHNRLIVDEYAAGVLKRIFSMRLEGTGYAKIAGILNLENILPPRLYYYRQQDREPPKHCTPAWTGETVKALLNNEIYLGHTVQFKHKVISYRDSRTVNRDQADWIRAENTHTPIINLQTWETVQEINERAKRRADTYREPQQSLFGKLVVCADCGVKMLYNLDRQVRKSGKVVEYGSYQCRTYRSTGGAVCSWHTIYELTLKKIVLDHIKAQATRIELDESRMLEALRKKLTVGRVTKADAAKEQRALRQRLHALDVLTAKLYEDKVEGIITDESFSLMIGNVEAERREKGKRLDLLEQDERDTTAKLDDIQRWASLIKEKSVLQDVDRELLESLIEKIEIGERSVENGVKSQVIKIYYKFVGFV